MDREQVAVLLAGAKGHISGEEMSRTLGVTRAAVWKEIEALRQAGWPIRSSTRKGYSLAGPPPALSAAYISAQLPPDSLFAGKVLVESVVDSTNTRLKARAASIPTAAPSSPPGGRVCTCRCCCGPDSPGWRICSP